MPPCLAKIGIGVKRLEFVDFGGNTRGKYLHPELSGLLHCRILQDDTVGTRWQGTANRGKQALFQNLLLTSLVLDRHDPTPGQGIEDQIT